MEDVIEIMIERLTKLGREIEQVRGEASQTLKQVDSPRQDVCPGSSASIRLFCELKTFAEQLVPKKLDDTRIDILPFDHSVHLDPNQHFRPRVLLKLQIIHATYYFQPAGASEAHCLHELEIALGSLGALKT